MSTTHDGPDAPDAQRIEHDIHHAVKRCRMVVRKGRQLLQLTQTKLVPVQLADELH